MTIHFICRGNAYRSLMAEAYLKSLHLKNIDVISSGTVADIYRAKNEPNIHPLIKRLNKYGVGNFIKKHPDQLVQSRVDQADINICLNELVAQESKQIVSMPANTITWDVMDSDERQPLRLGEDEWKYTDQIYSEIKQNIDKFLHQKGLSQRE